MTLYTCQQNAVCHLQIAKPSRINVAQEPCIHLNSTCLNLLLLRNVPAAFALSSGLIAAQAGP